MRAIYLFFFVSLFVVAKNADALLAAMAVDFGNEYMKIALVKAGVPMEMVLNRESKRKTRTMLSIRKDEREFGDNAMTVRLRYPKNSYAYVVELLGKKADHPYVEQFKKWFPFHQIIVDPIRGSILFEEDGRQFSPEELVAMLLAECRDLAENYAEQIVKDVVITVPPFWNQVERRAMLRAAEIAGLNLLQLMNDNTAAGVNYGMFRRKEFNETATRVLIYDMGALKTTATVFEYQLVQDPVTKLRDPQMTVLGVGYDRTLGGLEMTFQFRDHLAKLFRENYGKKAKTEITTNDRAMLKLLKEAERVKQVLSANQDHFAQVEGLHEDIDFRVKVTREDLDRLCADFYDRVPQPLNDALKMAEISVEKIDYIVLMGAGTRSLKVQEKLQAAVNGRDLGKYLNTDEAVAMGAVYQAAHRSKGFKVKKFAVRDIVLFPIQIDFTRDQNVTAAESRRVIHRPLFEYRSYYPHKKLLSFTKHTQDFEFCVNYGNLAHLNKEQFSYFGALNVTRVDMKDVAKSMSSKEGDGAENKGIKVHFRMDEGGILHVDMAEVLFERLVNVNETDEAESTFQKISKTLSGMFGGSDKGEEKTDEKKPEEATDKKPETSDEKTPEKQGKKKEEPKSEETTKEEKEEKKDDAKGEEKPIDDGKKKEKAKEKASSDSKEESTPKKEPKGEKAKEKTKGAKDKKDEAKKQAPTKKAEKPKPKSIKVPIKLERSPMDLPEMSTDSYKEALNRLKTFQKLEKEKRDREKAHNTLEAFVFEMIRQLDEKEYRAVSTEKEREEIMSKLKEVSEWVEEQGVATATKDFESKLKILHDATRDLIFKVNESKGRPQIIDAIKQGLNGSKFLLDMLRNKTIVEEGQSEADISAFEKVVVEFEKWANETIAAQDKLSPHDKPVLTHEAYGQKMDQLQREMKYVMAKVKLFKSKAKKTTPTENNNNKTSTDEAKKEDGGDGGEETIGGEEDPTTGGGGAEEETGGTDEQPQDGSETKEESIAGEDDQETTGDRDEEEDQQKHSEL